MRSVLGQTFDDWVHVIVNDGGDISPIEILINKYRDSYRKRITLINHESSLGMEAASNAGIRASQSRYILIHDDDDSLEPSFLAQTTGYLDAVDEPGIKGVSTLCNVVYEDANDDKIRFHGKCPYRKLRGFIDIAAMARINQFPPITFVYRREVLETVGFYDESLPVLGDWDFNLRFLGRYDIGVIASPLANYHKRPDQRGSYGNSLYDALDRHLYFDSIIRNRYLRSTSPIDARIGLLMNLAVKNKMTFARRISNSVYGIPGVARLVRALRRRGLLLRVTREL